MVDDDTDILARTIYGEARGEGLGGMKAVASVVMNRCRIAQQYYQNHQCPHPLFGGGSPASACKMPWQFSCWNAADPNCRIINDVDDSDPVFSECLHIATDAISGALTDSTNGATHYYDRRSPIPDWAEGKEPCAAIGHHLFFNNIN